MRGEIILFKKTVPNSGSSAWGSWKSCSNPYLRNSHEYIEVFSKKDFKLLTKKLSNNRKNEG